MSQSIKPCHRVIKKNGDAGNYFLGSKLKEALLVREYRRINTAKKKVKERKRAY